MTRGCASVLPAPGQREQALIGVRELLVLNPELRFAARARLALRFLGRFPGCCAGRSTLHGDKSGAGRDSPTRVAGGCGAEIALRTALCASRLSITGPNAVILGG